jgi:hypothetical protein
MAAMFLRHEGFLGAVGAFLTVHPMVGVGAGAGTGARGRSGGGGPEAQAQARKVRTGAGGSAGQSCCFIGEDRRSEGTVMWMGFGLEESRQEGGCIGGRKRGHGEGRWMERSQRPWSG